MEAERPTVLVLREDLPGERRVALTPSATRTARSAGWTVLVEQDAGLRAGFADQAYADAGASVVTPGSHPSADVVVLVRAPGRGTIDRVPRDTVVVGLLEPGAEHGALRDLAERGLSALAFEAVPRSSVAQTCDALSSQATAVGYAAVVLAASRCPRFFPMLTTAAGTVRPATVVVVGAGVAGLQAIATARRLGARVWGNDIRPEAREEIESLGARFAEPPLSDHVANADVVVTAAGAPGRVAPTVLTAKILEAMRPGTVVVDTAAAAGGNCEVTVPGTEIDHRGVTVLGPVDLESRLAPDTSELYARNVLSLLARMRDEHGTLQLDAGDPVVGPAWVLDRGTPRGAAAPDDAPDAPTVDEGGS